MKRIVLFVVAVLAVATSVFAQAEAESIERALAAAPRQMKEAATVIKWKADNTYDTLRKGTNRLVCYDRSGEPGQQPFAVQCTSLANLDRVAQNRKFEAITDKTARQAAIDAAEKDGTRVKPEYGSVWLTMNGADQAHARIHTTIAVPGATAQSTGLADKPGTGGAWIMNAGTTTAHIMTPGS
jgi:Ni/Co efflux regulator RcnB